MADGSAFTAGQSNDQVDTVLIVGQVGTASLLTLGLLTELLGVPFFGMQSAVTVLGISMPFYLVWVIHRLYWYSPGRQTTLSEWEEHGKNDSGLFKNRW